MIQVTSRNLVDRFGYIVPTQYGPVPWAGAVATFRPGEGPGGRDAIAVDGETENLYPDGRFLSGVLPPIMGGHAGWAIVTPEEAQVPAHIGGMLLKASPGATYAGRDIAIIPGLDYSAGVWVWVSSDWEGNR